MSLDVNRKTIDEILKMLKEGNWQIPEFQREYVWTQDQVKKFVISVISSYPVGLITTWDQPQGNPHTPGEPLKLKGGAMFKDFDVDPAVMKLILDGKQRLTTLAMVFGGFKSAGGQYSFSGEWYLDLQAYMEEEALSVVLYKKQSEVLAQEINSISNCIKKQLIPFKHFSILSDYIAKIHDPATYPQNEYPSEQERNARVNALKRLQEAYSKFLIPYAEIPSTINLGNVCEIFDVLNTTGTRVSTFDLLHNILFKDSNGGFNLRDTFQDAADTGNLGKFCDESRQEFFCQIVTGCFSIILSTGRNNQGVTSIKGPDLINTPLSFYRIFAQKLSDVDQFAKEFFNSIIKVEVSLKELPYPASSVLYFALRWKIHAGGSSYTVDELNKVYSAFFWRNVLTNRYDQGFLTQFSVDLQKLDAILENNHAAYANHQLWVQKCNTGLDDLFGNDYKVKSVTDITDDLRTEETRGALRQLYLIYLKSISTHDIVDGSILEWNAASKAKKVQIHHIFPKDWCKNNDASNELIDKYGVNCIANLIPLKAETNNDWKANSPATAIERLGITLATRAVALNSARIDSNGFEALRTDNVGVFWDRRSDQLANDIYSKQLII